MFLAVIAAYVVSAVFAFCGIVNTANYISISQKEMGYFSFIEGLVVTMWPLAVAMALLLLIQVACLIEKWMLLWKMAQASAPTSPAAAAPSARPQLQPAPTAAPVSYPTRLSMVIPPVLGEASASAPAPILSPIPPGMAAAPKPISTPHPPAAAPSQDGLNFFKLD